MLKKYFILGTFLFFASFSFLGEASAKIPQKCEAFTETYQQTYDEKFAGSEKAAFQTIEYKAKELLKKITVEHEQSLVLNQSTDNISMRSEFRLRSFSTRLYFQETFLLLGKSACIRKDVNDLEDMLSAIRLIALKTPTYLDEIDDLQKEIATLRSCSRHEESVYFDEKYIKANCEGGGEGKTSLIAQKFSELKDKIKQLTTGPKWKDILKTQGWKNAFSGETRKGIQKQAKKQASSWIKNNSLTKLLDYERYFGSQEENAGARRGLQDYFTDDKEGTRAKRENAALKKDQLNDAFLSLEEEQSKITEEILKGEKYIDASVFAVLGTSTAEYWKNEVQETAIIVDVQTKFLKKQKEALRKLINRHGVNIPDGEE